VVVGAGKQPRLLARRINGHGREVVVLDRNPDRQQQVEELDLTFILGDANNREIWDTLEPDTIRAVAVMLPDDDDSLQVACLVRDSLGIEQVVARVHDATMTQYFYETGVKVVNPSLSPVVELEYLLLYPSVSSLMVDLDDEHDVRELKLGCREFTGRPIRELSMPNGTMIVLVRRDGDVIYPRGDTRLQIGDQLTLMGPIESVRELARACEQAQGTT
jgi:Trk K+ transport system NAD-binding subunit